MITLLETTAEIRYVVPSSEWKLITQQTHVICSHNGNYWVILKRPWGRKDFIPQTDSTDKQAL